MWPITAQAVGNRCRELYKPREGRQNQFCWPRYSPTVETVTRFPLMETGRAMKQPEHKLILASSSPRRREILRAAGIPFEVVAPSLPEVPQDGESPEQFVCRMAVEKAEAALDRITHPSDAPILGADTAVVILNHTLGKPESADEARAMLRLLSGKEHCVLTGLCLLAPPTAWPCPRSELRSEIQLASTTVRFSLLAEEEIEQYVASGEPFDKAGGYGIQGLASKFIESIQGCYFNVVGLPVSLVYQMLNRFHSANSDRRPTEPARQHESIQRRRKENNPSWRP